MVRDSGDTLLSLVNQILDFAKIETGTLKIEPAPFDLRRSVGQVVDLLAPRAVEKGIELLLRVAADVPAAVIGDASRLRQVMVNLADNGIKFTEEGRVLVSIEVEERAEDVAGLLISVEDSGIGIARDKLDHLFGKFTQVDASSTRRYGGTGLGLAISKELVELMGGSVGVDSTLGEGSTFWVRLPLGVPRDQPEAKGPADGLAGTRVLLAGGSIEARRVVSQQVTNAGMTGKSATTGKQALEALREAHKTGTPFQAVLIDEGTADMAAPDLVSTVATDPELADTVLLVAASDRSCVTTYVDAGATGVIVKPVYDIKLLSALADGLARVRGQPVTKGA
jgi:CheY-like chemotaxis protein